MIPTEIIPYPVVQEHEHLIGCPLCGKNDGYINAGAQHWIVCREHQVKWLLGENIFEGWENQTIAQYQAAKEVLAGFREVNPFYLNYLNHYH